MLELRAQYSTATQLRLTETIDVNETMAKLVERPAPNRPSWDVNSDRPVPDERQPARSGEAPKSERAPTEYLHVRGLVRPLNVKQLQALFEKTAPIDRAGADFFWTDAIKTHCIVKFCTPADAARVREATWGLKFPETNPGFIKVEFCSHDEIPSLKAGAAASASKRPPAPAPARPALGALQSPGAKAATDAAGEQPSAAANPAAAAAAIASPSKRRVVALEGNGQQLPPQPQPGGIAEKEKEAGRSRESHREAERRPEKRAPAADVERERRTHAEHHREEAKRARPATPPPAPAAESAPEPADVGVEVEAKGLDDLFRRTKASPALYWLPRPPNEAPPTGRVPPPEETGLHNAIH